MALLGNPFIANVPKQLSNDELAQALRVDIAGEYEAIVGYEAHAMATNNEIGQEDSLSYCRRRKTACRRIATIAIHY